MQIDFPAKGREGAWGTRSWVENDDGLYACTS